MNTVGLLASGIWEDLSSPTTPTVIMISGYVGSDRTVGKVNLLIGTQFLVDTTGAYAGTTYDAGGYTGIYQAGDYYPALGNTEAAIFSEVYKQDYYDKKIRDALNGIIDAAGTDIDWTELSEGDTTIRRSNRNEVAKTYRGMQADSRHELQKLVGYYRSNLSGPRQVAGDDADPNYTNPSTRFNWDYYRGL